MSQEHPRRLNNRISNEIQKLHNARYKCELVHKEHINIVTVIQGPCDTPYAGRLYKLNISIPHEYPYKSPSICFITKIYHPNIDIVSGSICLDVLNQVWSPMYDLLNVIDIFIPQLLMYPNPSDPLNSEAGGLYINEYNKYIQKAEEYKNKYGIENTEEESVQSDSDSSCSELEL